MLPYEIHSGLGTRPPSRDGTSATWSWRIGPDGLRDTVGNPSPPNGDPATTRPEVIWIGGTSAAWGVGLNDAETVSSQLTRITDLRILNVACGGHMPHQECLYVSSVMCREAPPDVLAVLSGGNAIRYGATATQMSPSLRSIPEVAPLNGTYEALVESLSTPIYRHGGLSELSLREISIPEISRLAVAAIISRLRGPHARTRARLLANAPRETWPRVIRASLKSNIDWNLAVKMAHGETHLQLQILRALADYHKFRLFFFLQPLQSLAIQDHHIRQPSWKSPPAEVWNQYTTSIAASCQHFGIEFVDLSRLLEADEFCDSIHFTPRGAQRVAERIRRSLFD